MRSRLLANSKAGFTLVEVIVSLAIFGFIASAVLTLYLQGLTAWRQQEQGLDVQDNLRLAMDRMVREARQAESIKVYLNRIHPGENPPELVLNEGTPQEVRYYREGTNLYRNWQGVANPLASRVSNIALAYDAGTKILTIELEGTTSSGRTITLSTRVEQRLIP